MRSYSEMRAARDLEFEMCGENFKMRLVPARVITAWEEREDKADLSNSTQLIELANERIIECLEDQNGMVDRWKALGEREDGPTYGELADLMRWVLEVQTGLPTPPPSPSAPGRGRTAASSKAG